MRTSGLGWGEIKIAISLAQKISTAEATPKPRCRSGRSWTACSPSVSQGMGWGEIAQANGFKLGEIVGKGQAKKEVTVAPTEPATTGTETMTNVKPERAGKLNKPEKTEKPVKMEKAERPEKPEKPEKPARAEQPDKPEKPEKHQRHEVVGRTDDACPGRSSPAPPPAPAGGGFLFALRSTPSPRARFAPAPGRRISPFPTSRASTGATRPPPSSRCR